MVSVILKKDVPDFLDYLRSKGFKVIAPVKTGEGVNFDFIKKGKEAELDYINTKYPPKKFFLPDGETLFRYNLNRGKVEETLKKEKRIIFGIRPCDTHGLLALDKIFKDKFSDPYYLEKRKALLIAVNCTESGDNCFCQYMGTDRAVGYDLLLTRAGDVYMVEGWSRKGKKLLESGFFKNVSRRFVVDKLDNKKSFDSWNIEKRILKVFDSRKWEKIADKCLSCGACTLACPTCYCFSVEDEPEFGGKKGSRKRVWSYCMLKEFSRVAGENFRKSRTERCKQFIFHKLSYFMEEHGMQLCVGCGRCIDICPAGIDFFREVGKMTKRYKKK